MGYFDPIKSGFLQYKVNIFRRSDRCENRNTGSHVHTTCSAESIGKGRKALFEAGPRAKLLLAKQAQEAAYRALELNHKDDVAHHLIGRWNVGMAGLNFFVKACIKYVFGTNFRSGTMADALKCYEAAVSLRPDRIIHRVELARCYEHFGRREEAVSELRVRHLQ